MRLILSLLLILSAQAFLSVDIKAQTQMPASPSITVRDEEGYEVEQYVCIGKITFTVDVAAIVPTDKPAFNWTVSGGKIIGGQGTAAITVETGENFGVEITATVEVSGVSALRTKRDNRASAMVRVKDQSRTLGRAYRCNSTQA
jgi:molybdopterin-binding protein